MKQDITVTLIPGEEDNRALLNKRIAATLSVNESRIGGWIVLKKSVDARRGAVKIVLRCTVWLDETPPESTGETADGASQPQSFKPSWKKADPEKRVIIVGAGPAGLFAALRLLEDGFKPVIIERGIEASARKKDIALITREQSINPESNYCYGEGGAGAFSDGKLYTRSNKRGDVPKILSIFHYHGADPAILTDAHPHIGTDRLPGIIERMRETILSSGGEIHFGTRCVSFVLEKEKVVGIIAESGGTQETIKGLAVILATGHSAREMYNTIALAAAPHPSALEAKTFAVGVRVEHPRKIIDHIQYHGQERGTALPAAEYKLVTQAAGRGVYSFCMCPGGLIVPSATSDNQIVVNGMSPSGRNSQWSNAAIVVEIKPEDVPDEFRSPDDALSGLRFQQWIEEETKRKGDGQRAPAQRLEDFLAGRASTSLPECSYSPGLVPSRLDLWLPAHIRTRLREAFPAFNRNMKGFICPEALLVASETRTSSPVRILRDSDTLESLALPGLYPAGEGSGYAGGIVSSAMDGERCAAACAAAHIAAHT